MNIYFYIANWSLWLHSLYIQQTFRGFSARASEKKSSKLKHKVCSNSRVYSHKILVHFHFQACFWRDRAHFAWLLFCLHLIHGFFSFLLPISKSFQLQRDKLYSNRDFLFQCFLCFLLETQRTGFGMLQEFCLLVLYFRVSWGSLCISEVLLPYFKKKKNKKEWSLMVAVVVVGAQRIVKKYF